jgi:nitrogen fixation-related uncharacterized protein
MILQSTLLSCFFCGVDSRALLYFFLVFVISMVLASAAFLIWSISKGDFERIENAKYDVFNDPEMIQPGASDSSEDDRNEKLK